MNRAAVKTRITLENLAITLRQAELELARVNYQFSPDFDEQELATVRYFKALNAYTAAGGAR